MLLLLISGLSSNRCSKVLPLAFCLELGTRKPITRGPSLQTREAEEELIDVTLYFEIAPSMILTGCKNLNSLSDKTDSRDPASNTSVPFGRHAARRVYSTVICPSHNRNGSEPQERNPPRLVDANKLWEMKVCNLEERPSSNFITKTSHHWPAARPERDANEGRTDLHIGGAFCLRERESGPVPANVDVRLL